MDADDCLPAHILPAGVRARRLTGINGLDMQVLEAGYQQAGRPCVVLLHGFPELAYSWRKVMGPLAAAGYYVVAPDQRGYGRTTGWDAAYDGDLASFRLLNLVRDVMGLVAALGCRQVACVVGHDFGASVAAWCALLRPDIFRAVTLMSAPFGGVPAIPLGAAPAAGADIHAALAALERPRKHYQWYYSGREANEDMWHPPQGLHDFLRGYYHYKSADWAGNRPQPLAGWTAGELAKLPTYYVMDRDLGMAATVAAVMPAGECAWLTEAELAVYAGEYARTGFQGGLQWYRCRTDRRFLPELEVFGGRAIEVPACFIAGAADWGIHQSPGALARMQDEACARMLMCHLVEGAGHWVQQEQPGEVVRLLLEFLRRV
ncbi:MAG TPA: alpha/beta hydrolase [Acetobacteraceae bacterium]|jgi:pimeloyl-ACP methyl ester carboxylesterase|nr:alpha/beta hydrolase [Acetobacteraceae bacterium]